MPQEEREFVRPIDDGYYRTRYYGDRGYGRGYGRANGGFNFNMNARGVGDAYGDPYYAPYYDDYYYLQVQGVGDNRE